MTPCPHCGTTRTVGPKRVHVCPDTRPWTRTERDAWRDEYRRRRPDAQFTPTFQSERLGRHNRRQETPA